MTTESSFVNKLIKEVADVFIKEAVGAFRDMIKEVIDVRVKSSKKPNDTEIVVTPLSSSANTNLIPVVFTETEFSELEVKKMEVLEHLQKSKVENVYITRREFPKEHTQAIVLFDDDTVVNLVFEHFIDCMRWYDNEKFKGVEATLRWPGQLPTDFVFGNYAHNEMLRSGTHVSLSHGQPKTETTTKE